MTAELIEMLAYTTLHAGGETPWRCVACEVITRHTEDGIMPHLVGAHNADAKRIRFDADGAFLYPNPTQETQ
jgi:hypothetical protein